MVNVHFDLDHWSFLHTHSGDFMEIRFCRLLFVIMFFSLFLPQVLSAGVEIELMNGTQLEGDRIQWGQASTLVIESSNQGRVSQKTILLKNIKRLSIDQSHYDQKTIQLAAANRDLIQPVRHISIRKKYPNLVTQVEYQAQETTPPEWIQPDQVPCYPGCERSTIIGVHDDPLTAYTSLVNRYFPEGVPTLERGVVLSLMRTLMVEQALGVPVVPDELPPMTQPTPISGKLANVSVQATPLNTQGKADWNALAIRLQGFDLQGRPAPLSGNVQITLYGQRQLLLRVWDQQFAAKPVDTISLARWTCNCSTSPGIQVPRLGNRFGSGQPSDQTWIVKLPSPLPEHNLNIYAFGEIQVTLASAGNGVFEASTAGVPLRHLSLPRDVSLANTGSRFLPSETTSAGISRISRFNLNDPRKPTSITPTISP